MPASTTTAAAAADLAGASAQHQAFSRTIALIVFLPLLLLLVALVPGRFAPVPQRMAGNWGQRRVEVALVGTSLFAVEAIVFLLIR